MKVPKNQQFPPNKVALDTSSKPAIGCYDIDWLITSLQSIRDVFHDLNVQPGLNLRVPLVFHVGTSPYGIHVARCMGLITDGARVGFTVEHPDDFKAIRFQITD